MPFQNPRAPAKRLQAPAGSGTLKKLDLPLAGQYDLLMASWPRQTFFVRVQENPMFGIGPMEWAAILILALLIFGSRLPDAMRNLGRSVLEFKRGMRETENELRDAVNTDHAAPTSPASPTVADKKLPYPGDKN